MTKDKAMTKDNEPENLGDEQPADFDSEMIADLDADENRAHLVNGGDQHFSLTTCGASR